MFPSLIFALLIGSVHLSPIKDKKYDPNTFYSNKYFEGDILSYKTSNLRYHAVTTDSSLWPNGELIYSAEPSVDAGLLQSAMSQITQATNGCIRFREKQDNDFDYVNIFGGEGCFAEVGKKGGVQQLSLGQGCGAVGVYIHELLHTLGFYHHHSRSDRDEYLDIFWENIIPTLTSNFRKLDPSENQLLTPFDYQSIMMYGSMAFSKDGVHYTMLPKDYGVQIGDPGTKSGMTELDVTALKKLYSCDSKPPGNDLDEENPSGDPNGDRFGDKFGDNFGDDNNVGGNFGDLNEHIGENHIGNLPMPKPLPLPKPLPIPDGFGNISKFGQNKRNKPSKPKGNEQKKPKDNEQKKQKDNEQKKQKDNDQKKNQDKILDKNMDKLLDKLADKLKENQLKNVGESNWQLPDMPSLNYDKEQGKNDLKLNEVTGDFGIQGNLIDFSKLFGGFLKKK